MSYFNNILFRPAETIDAIVHALNDPKFDRVNFLVGTGVSGTLPILSVSMRTGIPYGVIRKDSDINPTCKDGGSHSSDLFETVIPRGHSLSRYIIIDDFIDEGNTVKRIISKMKLMYPYSQCVGIILYQANRAGFALIPNDIPVSGIHDDICELDRITNDKNIN